MEQLKIIVIIIIQFKIENKKINIELINLILAFFYINYATNNMKNEI